MAPVFVRIRSVMPALLLALLAGCSAVDPASTQDPWTIELAPREFELEIGESARLTASVSGPTPGRTMPMIVGFSSRDSSIAYPSGAGEVRGLRPGQTVVYAAIFTAMDSVRVTVRPR